MLDVVKIYEKIKAAARIIAAVPDPSLIVVYNIVNIRPFPEESTDKEPFINLHNILDLKMFQEDGLQVCLPIKLPKLSPNQDF